MISSCSAQQGGRGRKERLRRHRARHPVSPVCLFCPSARLPASACCFACASGLARVVLCVPVPVLSASFAPAPVAADESCPILCIERCLLRSERTLVCCECPAQRQNLDSKNVLSEAFIALRNLVSDSGALLFVSASLCPCSVAAASSRFPSSSLPCVSSRGPAALRTLHSLFCESTPVGVVRRVPSS